MNILITSGGTKVKIDLVRSITNMSRGTFGSRICDSFAEMDPVDSITFFHERDSKLPKNDHGKVTYIPFQTFDEYRDGLKKLVKENHFDMIVLAAAVSDYGPKEVFDGKYRSTSDEMKIELVKLPKVIDEISDSVPSDTMVCGFKLLVNSTDEELHEAMMKQFRHKGTLMVVGNDLRDIKNNNHRLTIKNAFSDEFRVYTKDDVPSLSDVVADECFYAYWALMDGNDK